MSGRARHRLWWTAGATLGAVAIAASTLWGVHRADVRRELERQTASLQTLRELRQLALEDYLRTIRAELILYSGSQRVRDAMRRLEDAWPAAGDGGASELRRLYVEANAYAREDRFRLEAAGDGSGYSEVHAELHPWAVRFRDHHGYYDVFLVDSHGTLVYSVAKEDDFGTNLRHGPWRETGLGRVVRAALEAPAPDFIAFADFEAYAPSEGQPASFIASPIFDARGQRLGVLALQVPTDRLNAILQFTPGMGRSGETYLVGADYRMRTDSRFEDESTILRTRVDTEAARSALRSETGVRVVEDYRGVPVLSAFGQIRFEGTTWALLAEIDEAEIRERAWDPRRLIGSALVLLGSLGTVLALALMFVLGRAARPTPWTDEEFEGLDA